MPSKIASYCQRIRGKREISIIGLVGLPGSGKSTVASKLHSFGFPIIVMGDAVRREAELRGIKPSIGNMRKLMLQLRRERGDAVVADLCIPLVLETGSKVVVIDGVRSPAEVRRFRKLGHVILVGIFCPRKLRFERLRRRPRKDAPKDIRALELRDEVELSVGLGTIFALADFMLINDGKISDLDANIEKIVRSIA